MFTRIVECTIKPELKDNFRDALSSKVLPAINKQPGFVDLIGLVSDDLSDHALVITLWHSKEDADRLYHQTEPVVDLLTPFLTKSPGVEQFYVTTSVSHRIAVGRAA